MMRHVSIVSLLVLLTACGSSPKTDFYLLSAEQGSKVQGTNANSGPAIGVWRLRLPGYLERSEIVTRDGEYEIRLADFAWWAGNLDENMTQLVANQLSQSLQSNQVVVSPWPSYWKVEYQTIVRVERFDGALGGEAVLRGVWSLLDADGQKELRREAFEFKESAAGESTPTASSYEALVAALSRLTVQLAEQVAKGIREQMSM